MLRLRPLLVLLTLGFTTAATAPAALVEIQAAGTTVATTFGAPEPFYDDSGPANLLELTAVFDPGRAPVATTPTAAVYEGLYGIAAVNGILFALHDVTLTVVHRPEMEFGSYELVGYTVEGWSVWVYGYGYFPEFATSLDFPVDGFVEPTGEDYRRWDIGASGAAWDSYSDQISLPEVKLFDAPWSEEGAPVIQRQPESTTVKAGGTAKLSVKAVGGKTLQYQWYHHGLPLEGETGPTLFRKKARAADAGWYSVTVSNAFGSAGSALVRLELR